MDSTRDGKRRLGVILCSVPYEVGYRTYLVNGTLEEAKMESDPMCDSSYIFPGERGSLSGLESRVLIHLR